MSFNPRCNQAILSGKEYEFSELQRLEVSRCDEDVDSTYDGNASPVVITEAFPVADVPDEPDITVMTVPTFNDSTSTDNHITSTGSSSNGTRTLVEVDEKAVQQYFFLESFQFYAFALASFPAMMFFGLTLNFLHALALFFLNGMVFAILGSSQTIGRMVIKYWGPKPSNGPMSTTYLSSTCGIGHIQPKIPNSTIPCGGEILIPYDAVDDVCISVTPPISGYAITMVQIQMKDNISKYLINGCPSNSTYAILNAPPVFRINTMILYGLKEPYQFKKMITEAKEQTCIV